MSPDDLSRLARQLQARIKDGRDGRDGEDGERGAPGRDGEKGERGAPGRQGETGRTGKEGHVGARGPQGETGAVGERGELGPMPAHRWEGTKLQFEQAPGGEWGKAVDLQGPRGEEGRHGVGGITIVRPPAGAGGGYSYFPGGWL